jgi:hypothetical protein
MGPSNVTQDACPGDRFASHLLPFDDHLVTRSQFLPWETLRQLREQANALSSAERSYVPTHKKGGTFAYETILKHSPAIAGLYRSADLSGYVSAIVGIDVHATPLRDQSSLSVLVYDRPGDHIGWHYDHNFYQGRHFTLLLALENTGNGPDGLSHAQLSARIGGQECKIATPPNTMVLFEGAKVLHKVSPILEGERRVIVSMTYCSDASANWSQAVARRVKDTAFFGVRALWS